MLYQTFARVKKDKEGRALYYKDTGRPVEKDRMLIDELFKSAPAMRPVMADMITQQAYQQEFGIFDHEQYGEQRPLALIAQHPKEDTYQGGPMFRFIRRYVQFDMRNILGITFNEWSDMPCYLAEQMLKIAEEKIEMKAKNDRERDKKSEMELKRMFPDDT